MNRPSRSTRCAPWLALLASALTATFAHADGRIGYGLELGAGGMQTQPFVVAGVPCASVGLDLSRSIGEWPACARVELRSTAGSDLSTKIPEAATGGNQSLVTALAGVEFVNPDSRRGAFLDAGLGVGRSTISKARGRTLSPDWGFVPLRGRTAPAYGLGFGFRFASGSVWLPDQVVLRTVGLFWDVDRSWAESTFLEVGFAFSRLP
jgi:hypothetical protein